MRTFIILLLLIVTSFEQAVADDWPQWLGPQRDSIWREEGIIERMPNGGLPVKWRAKVGWGYAGPAVAGGKVYLMDYLHKSGQVTNSAGTRDELTGTERVLCFDAATGESMWTHEYERPYKISYPRGPRCTPTVVDGKVYALGAEGNLWCLAADTGEVVWSKDLPAEYKTETPIWGYAAHPLVDDGLLYTLAGGEGSIVVALDKETGREVWRALSASRGPGYCPPTMMQHQGKKQLIIWHTDTINALDPKTGDLLWSNGLQVDFAMPTSTPRQVDDKLYATGVRDAAALIKLEDGETLWRATPKTGVICSISTPFIDDGVIYGNDGPTGTMMAARLDDGERLWQTAQPTTGQMRERGFDNGTFFMVKQADRFFIFNERGELIVARLQPDAYEELGRFQVLEPTNHAGPRPVVWSHPAFARKSVFARNDEELVCVDVSQ